VNTARCQSLQPSSFVVQPTPPFVPHCSIAAADALASEVPLPTPERPLLEVASTPQTPAPANRSAIVHPWPHNSSALASASAWLMARAVSAPDKFAAFRAMAPWSPWKSKSGKTASGSRTVPPQPAIHATVATDIKPCSVPVMISLHNKGLSADALPSLPTRLATPTNSRCCRWCNAASMRRRAGRARCCPTKAAASAHAASRRALTNPPRAASRAHAAGAGPRR
jgi:hypothetical protein